MVKLPEWVIAISHAKDAAQNMMKYLGSYLEGVPTTFDERVPTMAVDDCGRLYVNPQWCLKWTPEQNGYVLLHEMLHNLLNHGERRQEVLPHANQRQLECWNTAADLCIQQILEQWDAHRPKPSVCIDDYLHIPDMERGLATERYYSILYRQQQEDGGEPGDGPGEQGGDQSGGQSDDQPGKGESHTRSGSASDGVSREYEMAKDLTTSVANLSRLEEVRQQLESDPSVSMGSGLGKVKQSLNVRLKRQPDPFDKLRAIVGRHTSSPSGQDEYTYRKRNRRQEHDDLPLKGIIRLTPECVIVVDTSGSMGSGARSERVVRAMTAIAQGLKRVERPRVIAWDDGLQSDKRIGSLKQFDWQGGGGTSMDEAVNVADQKYHPDAIVLVTDCGTRWPDKPTRARLIVAAVAQDIPPPKWATVVDLTKEAPTYVG